MTSLEKTFLNHNGHYIKRNAKGIFITMFLIYCLCSCQKKPQITIYMGSNSVQNPIEGLQVENGDYQAALLQCQERLLQFQEESIEAADVYSLMGEIYADYLGDREKAIYYIEQAIEIHQKEEDEIGLAQDYGGMAEVYISIDGEVNEGLNYLEKAEELYRKNGLLDSFGLAAILSRKGQAYTDAVQYESALNAFKEAQEIHIKRHEESANIHLFTGKTYMKMQDYESAKQEYIEAQRVCAENDNEYKGADVNWLLGDLYFELEDYKLAIEFYEKSLEFYKMNKIYLVKEAFIYNNLAYAYCENGKLEQALAPAIDACRVMENLELDTNDKKEKQKIYKHNLSMYYKGWTDDMSEDGFEAWYQKVVIDGEDWREQ